MGAPSGAVDPNEASGLSLSAPERAALQVLRTAPGGPGLEETEVAEAARIPIEAARGSLQRLKGKHLAVSDEEHLERFRLTPRGSAALAEGLPERKLLRFLAAAGRPLEAADLGDSGLDPSARSAAIGILRRAGRLAAGASFAIAESVPAERPFPEELALPKISQGEGEIPSAVLESLKRRGLVVAERTTRRRWSASAEGRALPLVDGPDAIGAVTPDRLSSDTWRGVSWRPYDVRATVPRQSGAHRHPYRVWVEEFEEILVGLGFSELRGPLLETEFWNSDALFMPQDHPARSIQDVLGVRGIVGHPPDPGLLERVAAAHEGVPMPGESGPISVGWSAPYDRARAARPVLRSQTTAVSVRKLSAHPSAPFRYYAIDRNFRRDAVDATHHVEFQQCEGILGESGTSLRELIGTFQALAEAIGIRDLKIRPSYFPFTEPSIEGYVRHPELGWIEVFPGGLFRPEVLRPLGIDVPVAAWGIGITRLALVALGVRDIRELYTNDLERLGRGVL